MAVGQSNASEVRTAAWVAGRPVDEEASLIAAARRGDSAAIEQLLGRYERRIFRVALSITRDHQDAEEVVQDAFQRAFANLDNFHGESRFSTWLTRIAINQSLMKIRRHRPSMVPLDEFQETESGQLPRQVVDWGPTPEQRYSQAELREILDSAISKLDPAYRVVFQLRDVEQFSIQETAETLGLSISAVKSRLWRARLELRERLSRIFGARKRRAPAHLQAQPQYAR